MHISLNRTSDGEKQPHMEEISSLRTYKTNNTSNNAILNS